MENKFRELDFFRKIIVICFYGRSGSVFLHSLLDNHPNVVTFPGIYLMGYQEWWNSLTNYKSSNVIKSFLKTYQVIFDPYYIDKKEMAGCGKSPGLDQNFHQSGENKDEIIAVNKNFFKEEILKLKEENCREEPLRFFKKIHLALARTQNKELNENTKIVYHLHKPSECNANFLKYDSESVKIIYSIREPHVSAISLYKNVIKTQSIKKSLKYILSYMDCYSPMKSFVGQSIGVRLEDLHLKTDETIKLLAKHCELEMHNNLKLSTFLGVMWHNLPGANKVQGFNQVIPKKRHYDLVSPFDEKRYEYLFQRLYLSWGYRKTSTNNLSLISLLKRFQIEKEDSLLSYLESRFLMLKIILQNTPYLRRISFIKQRLVIPLLR